MRLPGPLRVVGDVHGDAGAFAYAVRTERFVMQLGDLVDEGPDSAATLRTMLGLIASGRGAFVLGNHDHKLGRALRGDHVRQGGPLDATLGQLDARLRADVLAMLMDAPLWLRRGPALFVHGAFHPAMLEHDSPTGLPKPDGAVSRALFGETTGRIQPDGFPERTLRWVDQIPSGVSVYCGHDRRSTDGRPYVRDGALGGRAVFMDTGAGKGGHLSWIDLDVTPP